MVPSSKHCLECHPVNVKMQGYDGKFILQKKNIYKLVWLTTDIWQNCFISSSFVCSIPCPLWILKVASIEGDWMALAIDCFCSLNSQFPFTLDGQTKRSIQP